jgi:hypothetical protein
MPKFAQDQCIFFCQQSEGATNSSWCFSREKPLSVARRDLSPEKIHCSGLNWPGVCSSSDLARSTFGLPCFHAPQLRKRCYCGGEILVAWANSAYMRDGLILTMLTMKGTLRSVSPHPEKFKVCRRAHSRRLFACITFHYAFVCLKVKRDKELQCMWTESKYLQHNIAYHADITQMFPDLNRIWNLVSPSPLSAKDSHKVFVQPARPASIVFRRKLRKLLHKWDVTFLSLYQSIPYEAYKGILFVHKDPFLCTQRYLFVPPCSPPFSPSHFIIPPSSPLLSLILLMPHTPTMA